MRKASRDDARRLRQTMTNAEVILWSVLRRRATGWKFRRQFIIGPYIADFACVAAKLVVEVDGATHGAEARDRDAVRTSWLQRQGWVVIRVGNMDVYRDLDGVWRTIVDGLGPPPSPAARGLPPQAGQESVGR
ncbi:MAG: DUF559 domain-containing protein [Hyphomonadaceae bacterium]|nr:DUF559 domain-containing protein [Hyphomonadaceae bacterium]